MTAIMQILLIIFSAYLLILLITTLINAVWTPMISRGPEPQTFPKVRLLVPARNEEHNLNQCLQGLILQNYPDFEIHVLDDHSTDRTVEIVRKWMQKDESIHLIHGKPLPEGWNGKTWACHQLSEAAKGDILIFTDADNTHASDAVSKTVGWIQKLHLGLISAFPQQITVSLAEKLVVPVFDNFVYSLLPMWLTYYAPFPSLSAGNGQWIAFTHEAYERIGGHAAVRAELVEDVELARRAKRLQIRILTTTGRDAVYGRMYHHWREVSEGFSKNAFGLTAFRTMPFFMLLFLMLGAHVLPYFLAFFKPWAVWSMGMIAGNLILKTILTLKYRQPFFTGILLHPVSTLAMVWIALHSWRCHRKGSVRWKGREIPFNKAKVERS